MKSIAHRSKLVPRMVRWLWLPLAVAVTWLALPASLRIRIVPIAHAASFTVTNTNDDGAGSLRNAIVVSNQSAGPNIINFNIPGSGVHTINLLSPLPAITAPVTIDGKTQPGYNPNLQVAALVVELNGSNAGANANGLKITAGQCKIYALVINRFNGSGISIQTGGGSVIDGNRIGTNADGSADLGNALDGIQIGESANNVVRNNLISGNDRTGVSIDGHSLAQGNVVDLNLIGTDARGQVAIANAEGIFIGPNSSNNTIGPDAGQLSGNLIAGNISHGIELRGNNNFIRGNQIGNNGRVVLPNGGDGIFMLSAAANVIGGNNQSGVNLISGNLGNGINLQSTAAVLNQIIGNRIGTDLFNGTPMPNGGNGILMAHAASANTIGGISTNAIADLPRNFIAYNKGDGVRVESGEDNQIIGNFIHDNTGAGVFNGNSETTLPAATSVLANRISSNGGLAIDTAPVGVRPNAADSVNALLNFPVLSSALAANSTAFIRGTLNARPNVTYRLEFFSSPACDPAGNGEAESFIGFTSVTTGADGSANIEFTSDPFIGGAFPGQVVTATSTSQFGATSELSPCVSIQDGGVFILPGQITTVSEAAGSVTLTVVRADSQIGAASVDYATSDGTATAGADYTAASGTLNFAEGETQKTITIPIINDALAEGIEIFHVRLNNPHGGPGFGVAFADVIIDDDEQPAPDIYAITGGNELLRFNTAHVGLTPLSAVTINGERILTIDFRPSTGQLYGLGVSGHLFTIDKNTGALTQVGTSIVTGLFSFSGVEFNPVTDRLRVVLADGRNFQINPDTGAISTDAPVHFVSGDPNPGAAPRLFGLANSNNFAGASATTTYALDWTQGVLLIHLVTLGSINGFPDSPDTGKLFGIGYTGHGTDDFAGFDISDGNEAFATMRHPDDLQGTGLFKVDLATAEVIRLGTIESPGRLPIDIAVVPHQRIQFSDNLYSVNENAGAATITVKRNGGASGALSVNYATTDGTATAGQDYTATSGTLNFADGETSKTFNVPLLDDSIIEGVESVNLTLSNVTNGAVIGPQSNAKIAIMDESSEPGTNPLDNADFFVRQHYTEFLGRNPDTGGLIFWTNHITQCFNDPLCVSARRVGTSAAFFVENEFQQSGSYIYRLYRAALGRRPSFAEFTADHPKVIGGVNLENSRQAFATEFVQRSEFLSQYPLNQDAGAFVDALIATASQVSGIADLANRRTALLTQYNQGTSQTDSRVRVVRSLIDDGAFSTSQYNSTFVLMQYFGYLQREPDQGGYDFWLDILNNRVPNNYRSMVCAFITSAEYQHRFSQIVTHNDHECGP